MDDLSSTGDDGGFDEEELSWCRFIGVHLVVDIGDVCWSNISCTVKDGEGSLIEDSRIDT